MKLILILTFLFSSAVMAQAQYKVKVNIIVLRDKANKGNNKWVNRNYVNGFLQEASKLDKVADFQLKSLSVKKDNALYKSLDQMPALRYAHSKSKKKEITVVISNERTNRTAGLAYISKNYRPSMAMRSRHYGANQYSLKAKKADAAIFLHELGHNMRLFHSGKVHTENYLKTIAGQNLEKNYYAKLTGQKPKNIASSRASASRSSSSSKTNSAAKAKSATKTKKASSSTRKNNRLTRPRLGARKGRA